MSMSALCWNPVGELSCPSEVYSWDFLLIFAYKRLLALMEKRWCNTPFKTVFSKFLGVQVKLIEAFQVLPVSLLCTLLQEC